MNASDEKWRALTDQEAAVLTRLLAEAFAGRDELAVQARRAVARRIDDDGSLRFRVDGPEAQVSTRVPVTGSYHDSDDEEASTVNILLHVVSGRLHELEIYKVDGTVILTSPWEVPLERITIWR